MGRAVGETMAVVMVAGNAVQLPHSLLDPVRTLTANLALEMGYASGDHRAALFATGMVLFLVVVILNGDRGAGARPAPRARGRGDRAPAAAARTPRPGAGAGVARRCGGRWRRAIAILIAILVFVLGRGLPHVGWTFLSRAPLESGRAGGVMPIIAGTLEVTGLGIAAAAPLGIGTAVYLVEYTREGPLTRIIRFGTDCLAGVPSIIFGLFGFVLFVITLRPRLVDPGGRR